jgi:hypothetical protein
MLDSYWDVVCFLLFLFLYKRSCYNCILLCCGRWNKYILWEILDNDKYFVDMGNTVVTCPAAGNGGGKELSTYCFFFKLNDWCLNDWCLTPTLAIFQLYRGFKL